jgi:hypothetical protein
MRLNPFPAIWAALGRACTFPFRAMGWEGLDFASRLKLIAFAVQTGGGVVMTGFAAYSMYHLARLNSVSGVLTMGMMALGIVGIVITGFGALLYQRTLELEIFGNKLKSSDAQNAQTQAIVEAMKPPADVPAEAPAPPTEGEKK